MLVATIFDDRSMVARWNVVQSTHHIMARSLFPDTLNASIIFSKMVGMVNALLLL